jgi:hypothetical protein
MNKHNRPSISTMDFDIHGIVGIRIINAPVKHAAALIRRLGEARQALDQDPDIIVRFEESISTGRLAFLGLNSAAFSDEGFFLLNRLNGQAIARIPFDKIGEQCEIMCHTGTNSIPLLFEIIRFTLLKKNYIPLHASAFVYAGTGVLVLGWTKGGKTEMLLSFANRGAYYVGDEWVVLSSDGQEMFGLPISIALWDWQFKYIPSLLPRIGTSKKIMFRGIHFLDVIHRVIRRHLSSGVFPLEVLDKIIPLAKGQLKIRELPQVIFKRQLYNAIARPDKVFLSMSYSEYDILVEPCDAGEIARRMASSNLYEHFHFFEHYNAFKFAFPQLRNDFLDRYDEIQTSMLASALDGKEAYQILHPYPVSLNLLFDKVQPFCTTRSDGSGL